jgi:hypothetical protein
LEGREGPERARLEALFKQLGLRKHCCDDGEEGDGTCFLCFLCIHALSIGGLVVIWGVWCADLLIDGPRRQSPTHNPPHNNKTGTALAPWWRTALASLVLLLLGLCFFGLTLYVCVVVCSAHTHMPHFH